MMMRMNPQACGGKKTFLLRLLLAIVASSSSVRLSRAFTTGPSQRHDNSAFVMTTSSSSSLAASTATTATNSRASSVAAVSPYSIQQQKDALQSLLSTDNPAHDGRHLHGHDQWDDHALSMLQIITATRLLDYQQLLSNDDDETTDKVPSLSELETRAQSFAAQHGALHNLQTVLQDQAPRTALAAEFKRASPSKGVINANLEAGAQTAVYAEAGASVISVLTEPRWFRGSLQDLTDSRLRTTTKTSGPRPAILRKDFVVSEYMIAEAAAAGADTVLLIVAVLPQDLLTRLITYCRTTFAMEPLVEVHAPEEVEVALQAGARVIGVNNRNLHTFQMDLTNSERVAAQLTAQNLEFRYTGGDETDDETRPEYTLCALSGMSTAHDVHRYRQAGLGMCLIGESLMRAANPAQAIASLCLDPRDYEKMMESGTSSGSSGDAATLSSGGAAYTAGCQIVKVCGMTTPEDALAACQAGANLIGVIFATKSKRCVTPEQATAIVQAVRQFGERQERQTFSLPSSSASPLAHLQACAQQLVATAGKRPLVVGVFQNQDSDYIAQMVQDCGLDLVQLHGREGFAAANSDRCGGVPALRVVDVSVDPNAAASTTKINHEEVVQHLLDALTDDPVAILMDTAIKGQTEGGGTSTTFDWTLAQRVQDAGLPVLVAGGLTPANIDECVQTTRPFGVDVSSGVEASPGIKDHEKVQAFVQTARAAAVEANKGF